jgi:hypothetical protein
MTPGARGASGDADTGDGLGDGDGTAGLGLGEGEGEAAGDGEGDGLGEGDVRGVGLGEGRPPWGFTEGETRIIVGCVGESSGRWQPQAAITAKQAKTREAFMEPSLEMTLETGTQVRLLSRVFFFRGGGVGWPASCSSPKWTRTGEVS